ncbi:MAG: GNAT family N-acetyltransferase [Deltaproteobacteria bacterium]|nr:GNAT family N-acetyltransferase [Deltaproteobacteria bacterium]
MNAFPITLSGQRVRLEPLAISHVDALWRAASESAENYKLTSVPASEPAMRAYVETALADTAKGLFVPFVTVDLVRDRVVGATRFATLERWSWPKPPADPRPLFDGVEIGWTWLAASAQRTHVNSEAKLLMLAHAFETWRVRRVMLKTDARNFRSRNAMLRIGAKFDGVIRAAMPAFDGGIRDSAYFSILESEWPEVKAHLSKLVSRGTS